MCSFKGFRVWDKGPRPDSVCDKAQTLLWAALVGCRVRASAVEAAKFVGTHVRRVAPTAAAWAHRHCAPALCLKVAQLVARGASPDRWHIGMHHELLVVQFNTAG